MSAYIAITATSIQDASGTPLPSGLLSFQATDQTGAPLVFHVGGTGTVVSKPITTPINAGAINSFQVPDPSQAAPADFYYRIVITDASGLPVLIYRNVPVMGTTWSFDTYTPS